MKGTLGKHFLNFCTQGKTTTICQEHCAIYCKYLFCVKCKIHKSSCSDNCLILSYISLDNIVYSEWFLLSQFIFSSPVVYWLDQCLTEKANEAATASHSGCYWSMLMVILVNFWPLIVEKQQVTWAEYSFKKLCLYPSNDG